MIKPISPLFKVGICILGLLFHWHGCSKVLGLSRPIQVLAFGDSLTEGVTSHPGGREEIFFPYGKKLQELFDAQNAGEVKVNISGIGGEHVVPTMRLRLEETLRQAEAQGIRYSWVLLLGGINDISSGTSSMSVSHDLMSMYSTITAHKARVLAMTCMENQGSVQQSMSEDERKKLNTFIRDYTAKFGGPGGMKLLDLDKLIPYVALETEERRREYYCDGLHLTVKGYDRLATLAFEVLTTELQTQGTE